MILESILHPKRYFNPKCKKDIQSEDVEVVRKALDELSNSSAGIVTKLYQKAQDDAKEGKNPDDEVIIDDKDDNNKKKK